MALVVSVYVSWEQVLVPGKQNYSLAIAWALDHDPVERVKQTLAAAEEGTAAGEAPAPASPTAADGTVKLETRKSLKIRRSASAQDAGEVPPSVRFPALCACGPACTHKPSCPRE